MVGASGNPQKPRSLEEGPLPPPPPPRDRRGNRVARFPRWSMPAGRSYERETSRAVEGKRPGVGNSRSSSMRASSCTEMCRTYS